MPNWCDCDLYIWGNIKEINKFIKSVKTDNCDIDNDKIMPYPKRFKDMDRLSATRNYIKNNLLTKEEKKKIPTHFSDGYNNGGYDWCCDNYGTKWGICNSQLEYIKTKSAKYTFETAWSPPTPMIYEMSTMFPKLTFKLKFYEGGMGFKGVREFKDGETLSSYDDDYKGCRGG